MVAMVTDNLGLRLEVRGMNRVKLGDNFMVGNIRLRLWLRKR